MSLYNMLNGFEPSAEAALALLGLTPEECGRFRDAWIEADGEPDGTSDFNARFWASAHCGEAADILNTAVEELNGTVNDHYYEQELKKPLSEPPK